jgi:hypothetical protein
VTMTEVITDQTGSCRCTTRARRSDSRTDTSRRPAGGFPHPWVPAPGGSPSSARAAARPDRPLHSEHHGP